ncbi:MAG: helix-turn-helix transcriptional regulator [Bauldia sp.]|nr:helix-turn-helix transcriptional regulator [Bauldia sp.]
MDVNSSGRYGQLVELIYQLGIRDELRWDKLLHEAEAFFDARIVVTHADAARPEGPLTGADRQMGVRGPEADGVPTWLEARREANAAPFSDRDRALWGSFGAQLANAVRLGKSIRSARSAFAATFFDLFNFGVVGVTASGDLVEANQIGGSILASSDALSGHAEEILMRALNDDRPLETATAQPAPAIPFSSVKDCGEPLSAFLAARPDSALGAESELAAILMVRDPSRIRSTIAAWLRRECRLTHREAELTLTLMRMRTLKRAAAEMGISWETSRRHLKSVFEKTGTHSQVELMQLLVRHPATLVDVGGAAFEGTPLSANARATERRAPLSLAS